MDYFDSKFNLYDANNQLVNSIDFEVDNPDYLPTIQIDGRKINFISKGENGKIFDDFGKDCLSAYNNTHALSIGDNNFVMKSNNETVWIKYPEKINPTCSFPTEGQSQPASNQKLIQFNEDPANENELTYLLSLDGTKIIIKDGNDLKVIDKETFENSESNFKTTEPVQKFTIN